MAPIRSGLPVRGFLLITLRKRMRSGDRPGLQNRRVAGNPVTDGFDPHSLPPFIFNELSGLSSRLRVRPRVEIGLL